MEKYSVVFIGKHDQYQTVAPEDAYYGESKHDAEEQAKKFSQDIGRFGEYVQKYDVCVQDSSGKTVMCIPFKSLGK